MEAYERLNQIKMRLQISRGVREDDWKRTGYFCFYCGARQVWEMITEPTILSSPPYYCRVCNRTLSLAISSSIPTSEYLRQQGLSDRLPEARPGASEIKEKEDVECDALYAALGAVGQGHVSGV